MKNKNDDKQEIESKHISRRDMLKTTVWVTPLILCVSLPDMNTLAYDNDGGGGDDSCNETHCPVNVDQFCFSCDYPEDKCFQCDAPDCLILDPDVDCGSAVPDIVS